MRLKLIAKANENGYLTIGDVNVVDVATNEAVENLCLVSFYCDRDTVPTLRMEILYPEIDIEFPSPTESLPVSYFGSFSFSSLSKFASAIPPDPQPKPAF